MTHHQPVEDLKTQYKNSSNLDARIALHRDFSTGSTQWYDLLHAQYLAIDPKSHILELGCGSGAFWTANQHQIPSGWDVTLTDFSEGMLADARSNLASSPHPFTFKQVNAQEIPFADDSFDCVMANHMLYHVPDLDKALSEIRRVLKPDGYFFAATNGPNHHAGLKDPLQEADPEYFSRVISFWVLPFRLDNGPDLLKPYFSTINLVMHDDSLHITQTEPLVNYLLSMSPEPLSDAALGKLHTTITDRIAQDGAIDIPKETGLFICRP
jgi:SAM-dependent methyltransferase